MLAERNVYALCILCSIEHGTVWTYPQHTRLNALFSSVTGKFPRVWSHQTLQRNHLTWLWGWKGVLLVQGSKSTPIVIVICSFKPWETGQDCIAGGMFTWICFNEALASMRMTTACWISISGRRKRLAISCAMSAWAGCGTETAVDSTPPMTASNRGRLWEDDEAHSSWPRWVAHAGWTCLPELLFRWADERAMLVMHGDRTIWQLCAYCVGVNNMVGLYSGRKFVEYDQLIALCIWWVGLC